MKQNLAYIYVLSIMASTLLLAGCCTGRHATQWEYKIAYPNDTRAEAQRCS
jgi:PBP1b-binding outer membrane lipoprotein LpoB